MLYGRVMKSVIYKLIRIMMNQRIYNNLKERMKIKLNRKIKRHNKKYKKVDKLNK